MGSQTKHIASLRAYIFAQEAVDAVADEIQLDQMIPEHAALLQRREHNRCRQMKCEFIQLSRMSGQVIDGRKDQTPWQSRGRPVAAAARKAR